MSRTQDTTQLLKAVGAGETEARDRLMPFVYDELHRMAHRELARRGGTAALQTTELLHEAYVKLFDRTRLNVESRAHFLALAATAMRHIVIDYARMRATGKRGGGWKRVTFDDRLNVAPERLGGLLELDDALERLKHVDERLATVVECRFFGDMTVKETAEAMALAPRTVDRAWQKAKAWLYREIHEAE